MGLKFLGVLMALIVAVQGGIRIMNGHLENNVLQPEENMKDSCTSSAMSYLTSMDSEGKKDTYIIEYDNGAKEVVVFNEDCAQVLFYDNDGQQLSSYVYPYSEKEDELCHLKCGDDISMVMALDRNGGFSFLYTGRNDVPRVSRHYFYDGTIVQIEYDLKGIIVSIVTMRC